MEVMDTVSSRQRGEEPSSLVVQVLDQRLVYFKPHPVQNLVLYPVLWSNWCVSSCAGRLNEGSSSHHLSSLWNILPSSQTTSSLGSDWSLMPWWACAGLQGVQEESYKYLVLLMRTASSEDFLIQQVAIMQFSFSPVLSVP